MLAVGPTSNRGTMVLLPPGKKKKVTRGRGCGGRAGAEQRVTVFVSFVELFSSACQDTHTAATPVSVSRAWLDTCSKKFAWVTTLELSRASR